MQVTICAIAVNFSLSTFHLDRDRAPPQWARIMTPLYLARCRLGSAAQWPVPRPSGSTVWLGAQTGARPCHCRRPGRLAPPTARKMRDQRRSHALGAHAPGAPTRTQGEAEGGEAARPSNYAG